MRSATRTVEAKERALHDVLRGCNSVLVAYSGGVDSVYLAKASLDALGRDRVLAVTGRSPSYPQAQHEVAVRVARAIGLPHLEITTRELDDPSYAANPTNRCYFCKTELYSRLASLARRQGIACVVDGSNADDLGDYRPGLAAARELGVRSPLQEAGLTKAEVRELSRRAELPTWEMPASPCLASRIPYGLEVTRWRLRQIEEAEERLRALHQWKDLRVRHHGDGARLELDPGDLSQLAEPGLRLRVGDALSRAGFQRGCLDLRGYRRGSLNEALRRDSGDMNGQARHHSDMGRQAVRAETAERGAEDAERCAEDAERRAEDAERRLAALGLNARVGSAGTAGELAVIRVDEALFPALLTRLSDAAVRECMAAGFRYVAVGLGDP